MPLFGAGAKTSFNNIAKPILRPSLNFFYDGIRTWDKVKNLQS